MHLKVLKYLSAALVLSLALTGFAQEVAVVNIKSPIKVENNFEIVDVPILSAYNIEKPLQVVNLENQSSEISLSQPLFNISNQNLPDNFKDLAEVQSNNQFTNQINSYFANTIPDVAINIPVIDNKIIQNVIEKGDTIGQILAKYTNPNKIDSLIKSCDKIYQLSKVVVGQPYTIILSSDAQNIERFEYEVDKTHKLIVNAQDDTFVATLKEIHYDLELARVDGVINSNLFEAVAKTGENASLAMNIANVFAYDVNFINEIREGDSFSVLVEKLYRDGEFKGYGNMIAANFTNQNTKYEAYLFANNGKLEYYNPKGENLKKTLLKAPLSITRVTSGYSMNRKHPISKQIKAHQGIDYGAPKGTPVLAVGDGTVTFVGTNGGFGKQIVVKHSAGFESLYSHLNGYAAKVKKGTKVTQGQTIGFVGSTGISTGPHLDFRLKQNNKYINPTKAIVPRADPISKTQMVAFQSTISQMRDYLDGKSSLTAYNKKDYNF